MQVPGLAEHQRQLQEHQALVQQSQPQQLPQQQQQTQFNVQQQSQQPTQQQVLATHQQGKINVIFSWNCMRNAIDIIFLGQSC